MFIPSLRKQALWHNNGVLLEIPNAVLSLHRATRGFVYQLNRNGTSTDLNFIAFSAKAEIELNAGGSVTIDVRGGHPDFPKTLDGSAEQDLIVFNNNCFGNSSSPRGDLQMLYDYIIDVPAAQQFTDERHPLIDRQFLRH